MEIEFSTLSGYSAWTASQGAVEVCFLGRSVEAESRHTMPFGNMKRAWLDQIHSQIVLDAIPGNSGRGDALLTKRQDLMLTIVTADCVPVLLAGERSVAAVHAGWRGLSCSILPRAVGRLQPTPRNITAWIGPAIGPCCYEVGQDVAESVCNASSNDVAHMGPRGRPHLDLVAAATVQLKHSGVHSIHSVEVCTHCRPNRLWSYRREGPGAGRNLAAIWRRSSTDRKSIDPQI